MEALDRSLAHSRLPHATRAMFAPPVWDLTNLLSSEPTTALIATIACFTRARDAVARCCASFRTHDPHDRAVMVRRARPIGRRLTSVLGTEQTCGRRLCMSAVGGSSDNNCSGRAFPVLTHCGHGLDIALPASFAGAAGPKCARLLPCRRSAPITGESRWQGGAF